MDRLIEAGRVGRPHGLDGSFHVKQADARLLAGVEEVWVRGRAERIDRRAGTSQRPILRLAGHNDREAAAALRGEPLAIPADRLPPLEEGEYWGYELEGCAVWDGGLRVGIVRGMLHLPSCEALEVARDEGGELLIPLVRDAIRAVDVVGRRIDVDLAFLGE
jgi:16S rRNA processing protein RimM